MAALAISIIAVVAALASAFYTYKTYASTERWRTQERREARPQFTVTAEASHTIDLRGKDGRLRWPRQILVSVEVTVENTSTRDATINNVGIECIKSSTQEHYSTAGTRSLPHALPPGHQLSWSISGAEFYGFLSKGEEDVLPRESEFVVFVSRKPWTSANSERWDSNPIAVRTLR